MLATAQVLADWDWEVGHGAPRCPLQAATHGTPRKVGLGHTFTHTHTYTHTLWQEEDRMMDRMAG